MTLKDKRGVELSTGQRQSVEGYEEAVELMLGYYGDPLARIDLAIAGEPDFVMGHCFRAGLIATTTDQALDPELRASAAAAARLAGKANDRERAHIAAVSAWADGDMAGAVRRYGTIAMKDPGDIFAIQMAHLGDFFLGQSGMLRDRIAGILPGWSEQRPGYGYILGMYAFGLEESADYDRAEETGRRALDLNRRDPWAVHAVAHVMEMQGRQRDGISWLTTRADDWSPDNAFAYHNWWHLALYHLDLGETETVLRLYDERIRPQPSKVPLEMIDASAMLWRLALRGVDVGGRWRELAECWKAAGEGGYYAFNDCHAMLSFVAAGMREEAAALLATMRAAASGTGTNARMTREVGLPLAEAVIAFANGDHGRAVDLLQDVRLIAHRFGGSHAQRDLIGLTLLESALRSGQGAVARALAAERTALKSTSPFNWRLAARAAEMTGEAARAEAALRRAGALAA
ncbi:MAG: tetratricopeptide repeat protein [Alphaproteobacteria bacterium]|nr:tetratricopeptide repeat protein [Alphaproteobacteria bacterium]